MAERIDAVLPEQQHSWKDKGTPWLFVLLFSLIPDLVVDGGDWVTISPHITASSDSILSLVSDERRMANRSRYGGHPFRDGNRLAPQSHIDACYNAVISELQNAFSERIVCIKYTGGEYYAFEYSTALRYSVRQKPLTTWILDRTNKERGILGIYFKIQEFDNEEVIIDDILIIPDVVYAKWSRRTGFSAIPKGLAFHNY
ncbi:hypothetical protein GGR51DRAFT_544158 [Nemania sp. FL0031]|nr:hypothetical protein GGR51DRAFT_544158 [Nemania sp. FL0031]